MCRWRWTSCSVADEQCSRRGRERAAPVSTRNSCGVFVGSDRPGSPRSWAHAAASAASTVRGRTSSEGLDTSPILLPGFSLQGIRRRNCVAPGRRRTAASRTATNDWTKGRDFHGSVSVGLTSSVQDFAGCCCAGRTCHTEWAIEASASAACSAAPILSICGISCAVGINDGV